MRYYIDFEFIDDPTTRIIDPISIGIVCEDARELYYVNKEFNEAKCDEWLRVNVLPKLPKITDLSLKNDPVWKSRSEIREAIKAFIYKEPKGQVEIWAYVASCDWICFYQLFGRLIDLPEWFPKFVLDIKQYALDIGYTGKLKDLISDEDHHDALADARWNLRAHQKLRDMISY